MSNKAAGSYLNNLLKMFSIWRFSQEPREFLVPCFNKFRRRYFPWKNPQSVRENGTRYKISRDKVYRLKVLSQNERG